MVKEFFESFKTPCEFYRPGRNYDVVVATAQKTPDVSPQPSKVIANHPITAPTRFTELDLIWGRHRRAVEFGRIWRLGLVNVGVLHTQEVA